MELFIDADGCPVTNIAVALAKKRGIPCTLLCDTAHEMQRDGAKTITVSKGADSVDFARRLTLNGVNAQLVVGHEQGHNWAIGHSRDGELAFLQICAIVAG